MAQSEEGHQDVYDILLRYTQQGSNTQQTERGGEGEGGTNGQQQETNTQLTEVRSIHSYNILNMTTLVQDSQEPLAKHRFIVFIGPAGRGEVSWGPDMGAGQKGLSQRKSEERRGSSGIRADNATKETYKKIHF